MKPLLALLPAPMLLATGVASAQDALRYSWAGDAMSEAQRQQQVSQQESQPGSQLYNYKAGDFRLLLVPALEVDWNDNVNVSRDNAQSDVIVEPFLQLNGSYPLTQRNLLSLSVGVGYSEYLEHSTYNHLDVASQSQLSFDMYVKDFWINFHDRFSVTEDSGAEAAVAGTALYGTFMNTAGLTVTWESGDVVLTLGYDHQNAISTTEQFSYLDRYSELPLARAGLLLSPDLTVGVEGAADFTTYDQSVLNDNQSYSAGLYADWKPSSNLRVQPRAGYTIYQFQHTSQSAQVFDLTSSGSPVIVPTGESIQTQDLDSWYADLTLSYKASEAVNFAFSAGHEIRLGILSDVVEDSYVRPNVTWTIVKDLRLNTALSYEHGSEGVGNVTGNVSETYNWFVGDLMASYPLTKKFLLTLNYRLTLRSSDVASLGYTQNQVGLRLTYQLQ
jgi:hypothetical protein